MKRVIQISAVVLLFTAFAIRANTSTEVENIHSKEQKNLVMAKRFYQEVVNSHNVGMIDSFAAKEYVEHQYDTHFDGDLKGTKKAFNHYFTAFPDIHVKVNFMIAENDIVMAQITTTGTNTGSIYGRPATNKKVEINGVDIIRFKHGKAVEHWGYAEEGKMLTQLGLVRSLLKEGREKDREPEEVIVK